MQQCSEIGAVGLGRGAPLGLVPDRAGVGEVGRQAIQRFEPGVHSAQCNVVATRHSRLSSYRMNSVSTAPALSIRTQVARSECASVNVMTRSLWATAAMCAAAALTLCALTNPTRRCGAGADVP